ncbi:LysR family transcriptional regulator [Burkholderia sp. GS2Y]|uniref:LysR family transcriptional regulator n=1 Tax=Burkholderia theae TaxID=3143496 RepID=A0ABU9WN18_9BURK
MNQPHFPTLRPPTLKQLRAFAAVYELRKLTAAAQRLSITQSAISVLIRQLEDGLGTRLFDRTTRSLRPTRAADETIVVVERILRDLDSLGTGLRDLTALRRGRVSVAVTPTLGEIVLPEALRQFVRQHPNIHVAVDDCAPDQFVARVVGEHVDFGIGAPERAAADVDTLTLRRDHLAVVLPYGHALASQRQVRWSQLAGHAVITVRPGYGIRPLIDAAAARAGVSLNVVNEVAFLSTALWMADCGLGAAIMPSAYAARGAHKERVVLPLVAPKVSRDVALVTKRGRSLSSAAQHLVDVLVDTLKS